MCLFVQKHKQETQKQIALINCEREKVKTKTLDKINEIQAAAAQTNGNSFGRWFAVIVLICVEKIASNFPSMEHSLDMDMDGSLNRSLTNSQIYDGEFFEIVGSEGEILVVRYERVAFSLLKFLVCLRAENSWFFLRFSAAIYAHRTGMMVNCYALRWNQTEIF